ncbi:hypothetical protein J437_LFUL006715 [Ladona fulva]|uniref:Orotidine 5'-phosphate decarboxylase n=1 Tax=Ladona fulva TaxID=123851 RepID=A0A8K0JSI1_LADFU|nr:hypothetical protein J437_LFUL006715 [Ladona fulva]
MKLTYGERSAMAVNSVGKALFQLMEEKKTNLCVAVDVTTAEELLRIAAETGPYICLFKTHVDAVENFTESTAKSLLEIAQKEKFIILEDRKFADIGKTVSLQYGGGPMKIVTWADLVTCHSISGENAIIGLKSASKDLPRGCFLVAEMSSEGNLITPSYTKATLEMAEMHPEFVVGLVTQSIMKETSCGLIQLTPGVRISSGSVHSIFATDGLGQRWSSPEDAVLTRGADIVVVGRGITEARYILHILCEKGHVDEAMVKKTEDYLKKSQIAIPKPKVPPAKGCFNIGVEAPLEHDSGNFLICWNSIILKFADIGKTVSLQYGGGPMKIVTWADLVTCHSISGENAIIGLKSASKDLPRGCFLVAEMSSEGNLITPSYTKATLEMAEMHPEFVVGLVTQSIMKETSCGLIQLTPGVRISSGSVHSIFATDGLGQRWSSPEDAVLTRGADIVVVGRGITEARYVKEAAVLYQTKLWSAYLSRVG